jgi:hypothetical protein
VAIHEDLHSKPLYHPYPQTKRSSPANAPPVAASTPSTSSSEPGSPLTPPPDELPKVDDGHPQPTPQPILIPSPQGTLSVASLNLHLSLAKDYRVSLISYLNVPCSLCSRLLQRRR